MIALNEVPAPVERAEIKNYTPLPATKNRLMLYVSTGDSSVLKPTQTVPPEYVEILTPTMEYDISKQNFAIIENASNRERLDKAGVAKKDIPEAVKTWAEKNAKVINKKANDRALKMIFKTAPENVTTETMINFYDKYFSGPDNQSNVKLFIEDVVHLYTRDNTINMAGLKQDLTSFQSLAGSFGTTSGEIITQLIDAEVEFLKDQYVDKIDIDAEINNIKPDDKRLLNFLIEDQQIDEPRMIPKKVKPTVIPTTVATNLGVQSNNEEPKKEAIQQSEILKGGAVEIASHLFASPEHPEYTEDKIVKKTLANGQSGLMAAIDGIGGQGIGNGLKAAEITQAELLKIASNEVPTIDQAYDLIDNSLIESGIKVRKHIKTVHDKDADAVVSGGIFCKSPNEGDERKFFLAFNSGDARTYRYNTITGKIQQITVDGSYVNDLVMAGLLTHEEAKSDSRRNIVSKSVGGIKSPDDIHYIVHEVKKGDVFFSTSDGLIDQFGDKELNELIQEASKYSTDLVSGKLDLKTFAKTLATEARKVMIENNSPLAKSDDVCVVAMKYNESIISVPVHETTQPELNGRELFDQYYEAVREFNNDKANLVNGKKVADLYSQINNFEDTILPKLLGVTQENLRQSLDVYTEYRTGLMRSLIDYTTNNKTDPEATTKLLKRVEDYLRQFNEEAQKSGIKDFEPTNIEDLINNHEKILNNNESKVPAHETSQPDLSGRELIGKYAEALKEFDVDGSNMNDRKRVTDLSSQVKQIEDLVLPELLGMSIEGMKKNGVDMEYELGIKKAMRNFMLDDGNDKTHTQSLANDIQNQLGAFNRMVQARGVKNFIPTSDETLILNYSQALDAKLTDIQKGSVSNMGVEGVDFTTFNVPPPETS